MTYIYERKEWPAFRWDPQEVDSPLSSIRYRQGRLLGRMEALGFAFRSEAVLQCLTEDVLNTSEIEGENLDRNQVRSSLAQRLGLDAGGLRKKDRHVDGIVEIMVDATQNYERSLTKERLFSWHAALFPTGRSGMHRIAVGGWRKDADGPMEVVSGPAGRSKVHFRAPEARHLPAEMKAFLSWFDHPDGTDPVLRAAVAHLWFVTIHPFEDGNGRIARAIADLALARSEGSPQRFYSMSARISSERKAYYDVLESTQKGSLDISGWLRWFLDCLDGAIASADTVLESVLAKARFWETHGRETFNPRQIKVIERLLSDFDGKLTSSKWAALGKCSQDSAGRDIDVLLKRGILIRNPGAGRSTSYSLQVRK